jgi:hypothetical protein
MDIDGKYTVWFRTLRGEGTGIVHLLDGKLTGGDSFFTYDGTYEPDDTGFSCTLTTRRHTDGPTTLFGLDEVELKLKAVFKGGMAQCQGVATQMPDLRFDATLFGGPEPRPAPDAKRPAVALDVTKFAKISAGGPRSRNPFTR